ncbi:hypothetical protein OsI_33011 [Oryza sativa Indica Group]|uniref:ABC transporter domain-containing protein n=1 Tax=Oryza sativa subsp. indica TaxID=39946 RepID=B8BG41_ORYSI|nr:hypothetical protein OsI_33011 [Oryza sativa Indica Group]
MAFAAGGIDHHVAVDVEGEEESRRRAVAEEADLLWAAFERLPSAKRRSHAVVLPDPDGLGGGDGGGRGEGQLVDVRKLDRPGLQRVLRHALATSELDNANLLHGIKARFDAVGLEVPRVEVRFQNLTVSTDVHVGRRALPTLVNYVHDIAERILISSHLLRPDKHKLVILDDVSGVIKPGRMTLLLGPPASGKSTLLLALADKLDSQLKKSGEVAYNGMALDQFCVQRTSAYISQTDNHIGELTVRETLDFAAKCQGASENWQECLKELVNLEKERGIRPSPEIDAFMKTASFRREKHNLVSDYVLRVLGLDICADTPVGSDMERGVSGGQKKRVTTGEMIIGPRKTLLMDEISTGLDSSTTFQIVNCMRNFVHEMEATVLMSLLQPAPETFELFDDLILLSEGKIIYQGPIKHVVDYFKSLGFSLPPRKGIADFLQEVTSKKDQAQYWSDQSKQHIFVSASEMAAVFKESQYEMTMTISRLPVFYKQRDNFFHPAWAFSLPNWILRIPYSFIEAVVWSCVVYYTVSVSGNMTVGTNILISHSLPTDDHWFWIGVGVLLAYSIFFNIMFTLALAFLNPLRKPQSMVPSDAGDGRDVHINTDSNKNTIGEIFENNDGFEGQTECKSKKGMILPFQPLTMTFHNVNYYVNMPKEMQAKGVPEKRLQLLSEVSGIFRPRVLTALVGASGSGKTTLMDVLAGRKTGGYIEGDIRISGHKKEQRTFARIAGYVEQNDIHSPQAFVEEVMALVELDQIRYALVGKQGLTGLSTEQRKRLTIAVELVANPSIIFMDEPTSGLDARAAAIVMRTVRNTVDTGRTVVCTIHQPSIDIFEAFDELLLMKRGGRVIYGGSLGVNSVDMINYFQGIPRVVPITEGYNPATWMLEVTTQASEERLGIDFATVYKNSYQFRNVENLIVELSIPASGTEPLKFSSEFSQNRLTQFMVCLRKQSLVYWRSPEYNVVRLFFTSVAAIIFGSIFWNVGMKRESTEDILLIMGALYAACLFLGVNNASSVQPVVSVERTVYYRERAANMYSSFPYAAAQGLVEIPYIAVQTLIFGLITYFMVNYERNIRKLVLYLIYMFLTFTYFTFYGMVAVGLTPTQHMASVVSSAFYSLWNLLSGFLIPQSRIPGWWIWFYYICPVAWTLRGVITSQLGDVDTRIVGPGFDGTVHEFLQQNLGFEQGMTGATVAVLVAFSVFFFSIYAISIKMINFQRR